MSQKILEALAKLEPTNDNHWTGDGQPRIDTVKMFAGVSTLLREDLLKVSTFTRADALAGKKPEPVAAPSAPPPPATNTTSTSVTDAPAESPPPAPAATTTAPAAPASSAPAAPAAPAAEPAPPPFDLEASQKRLSELEAEKVVADAELVAALKKRDALNSEIDPLRALIQKHLPPDTNTNAIQDYLASQKLIRERRAEQIRRAQGFQEATGVQLRDLIPQRSPLDQAMARKNARGASRPR